MVALQERVAEGLRGVNVKNNNQRQIKKFAVSRSRK